MKKKDDDIKTDNTAATAEQTIPAVNPVAVVDDFIESFLSYMSSSDTVHTDAAFVAQISALTDEFSDSITSPNQGLTVSPIILAQDIPASFTISSAAMTDDESSVTVTLNFATPSKLIYSLVIVDNEWKISGVTRG